jgi:hypothetical protein
MSLGAYTARPFNNILYGIGSGLRSDMYGVAPAIPCRDYLFKRFLKAYRENFIFPCRVF